MAATAGQGGPGVRAAGSDRPEADGVTVTLRRDGGQAASPTAARGVLRLEVVRDTDRLVALRGEWNRLLAASPQCHNPMLTHEWFQAWWESFGDGKRLLVLLVRSGDRLVAIAPFMSMRTRYHGLPIRLLSLITNDHTNRADLIVAERPSECLRLVLEFLVGQASGWDMAELNFLPLDSPTLPVLRQHAADLGLVCGWKPSYASPFIPLERDWGIFYGTLNGHFRRNMKNREKRLAALGTVEHEEFRPGGRLPEFLDEMFVVGDRSWKGEERTAIGSTPALRRFYRRLAELLAPTDGVSLHLLRVGGRPVAFHYSLRNHDAVYLLKTEYDQAYHKFSAGHQIQKVVLQGCYERGLREFDFLGPDMPWKRAWSGQVRPHTRLLLFHRGLRSRVCAFMELRAKPVLKRSALGRWLRPEATDTSAQEKDSRDADD